MSDAPNPGSDAALKLGCRCPILDNAHGRGVGKGDDGKPLFWIAEGCKMHAAVADLDATIAVRKRNRKG